MLNDTLLLINNQRVPLTAARIRSGEGTGSSVVGVHATASASRGHWAGTIRLA